MHLAISFTLLMCSFAAAASLFQHAQINVEATHCGSKNQAEALYSSGKRVFTDDGPRLSNLPFNFTLIAHLALGIQKSKLPFGFADLTEKDGFNRGELGYETEFALLNGKLRNGNRALAWHVAKILPPWTSLWSFHEDDPHKYFDFVAISHLSGEKEHLFLEFASTPVSFGVLTFNEGEPVFIGPVKDHGFRIVLEIKEVAIHDINTDFAEELR